MLQQNSPDDPLTLFFQVGDASDPELHDAPTVGPGGVEECDRHVCDAALPQHGKVSVLHSGSNYRKLTQTPLCPQGEKKCRSKTVETVLKGSTMLAEYMSSKTVTF